MRKPAERLPFALVVVAALVLLDVAIQGAIDPLHAATITYSSPVAFEAALSTSITDNYTNSGYVFLQNDSQMSAVLGETKYMSTGFPNLNIVENQSTSPGTLLSHYCAGCNGSFILDFTATTVGSTSGVFGVGFDFFNTGGSTGVLYDAFVTFGDGSTHDYALDQVIFPQDEFFGITSTLNVKTIAFGPDSGETTQSGQFGLHDLTIGSAVAVPEPGSLAIFGIALSGVAIFRRRRLAA